MCKVLAYACETCGEPIATPQISAGRVFAALEHSRDDARPTEMRFPEVAEDIAYLVFAALGMRPSGDSFALPIALGMRAAIGYDAPPESWMRLDSLDKKCRARPVLSDETLRRLDGLQKAWGASDRSTVARWLLVAGAESLGLI